MPDIDKIEKQRRIRMVMEWIIDDYAHADIVTQIMTKWGIEHRQANRYIKEAREEWSKYKDEEIEVKKRRKIESLKKLKRSLKESYKGTPAGIKAVLDVESKIIALEGLEPAKQLKLDGGINHNHSLSDVDIDKLPSGVLIQLWNARIVNPDEDEENGNEPDDTEETKD